jgi:hypothetical protein
MTTTWKVFLFSENTTTCPRIVPQLEKMPVTHGNERRRHLHPYNRNRSLEFLLRVLLGDADTEELRGGGGLQETRPASDSR